MCKIEGDAEQKKPYIFREKWNFFPTIFTDEIHKFESELFNLMYMKFLRTNFEGINIQKTYFTRIKSFYSSLWEILNHPLWFWITCYRQFQLCIYLVSKKSRWNSFIHQISPNDTIFFFLPSIWRTYIIQVGEISR